MGRRRHPSMWCEERRMHPPHTRSVMAVPSASRPYPENPAARVRTDGKFLRRDGERFFLNGVSYGPFAPNSGDKPWPERNQLLRDFEHIRSLGFNAVRIYELPSELVLHAAETTGLCLIVGIPWADHVDFLADPRLRRDIERRVRHAARHLGAHKQVAAFLVGNEIEKTLVRWMGPSRVRRFLEDLIAIGRSEAPDTLFSYATYPSTEYLVPRNADFVSANVYLEQRDCWERYLRRLQNQAGSRPLVIAEFGIDVLTHGEQVQAEIMRWQRESAVCLGVAGNVWFAYTDDWHRGGADVRQWSFGLVDRQRNPRAACRIAPILPTAPGGPLPELAPRISAIVCTRNGSATLGKCLDALSRQTHPDYEVIVVDDGSTDATPEIAMSSPRCRYLRQEHAGLGAARNLGAAVAKGEILAYTDDDCIPDEEWLLRISAAFDDARWVAAGGLNLPPAPRNWVEALVAASPGAPVQVLLNDEEAEHLPGCNFGVRKDALERLGGFHSDFATAGDDVDICWRLREAGGRLRFVPAAMVWHHRRLKVRDYLIQQSGYGRAEALLMKHHPSRFGPFGGARWSGGIYGDAPGVHQPVEGLIFHGPFGFAPFQAIYPQGFAPWWDLCSGVPWMAVALLSAAIDLPGLATILVAGSIWAAWLRMTAHQHALSRPSWKNRLLLVFLCWSQPIVREGARLIAMVGLGARPACRTALPQVLVPGARQPWSLRLGVDRFWNTSGRDRSHWLEHFRRLAADKDIPLREDDGWRSADFQMWPGHWISWGVTTVTEYHGSNRCLTRVGSSLLIPRWLVVFLALLVVLGVALRLSGSRSSAWLPGLVSWLLPTLLVLGFIRWLRVRRLIRLAARLADLIPIDANQSVRRDREASLPKTASKLAPVNECCQSG